MAERVTREVLADYFAAFDEPERAARLVRLERCFDESGEIRGPRQVFRGHGGIEAKIGDWRQRRPGERLVPVGEPESFRDGVAMAAALVTPDGEARAEGEAFFEFAPDGRIRRVLPCWLAGPARPAPWPGDEHFRELERRCTRALVARDLPALEALHSPAYALFTPPGRRFTREAYLATIAREPFYAAWEAGEMAVRRGRGLALVRYPARLVFPSGNAVRVRHTDAYEPGEAGWRAFASFATLREDGPG